MNKALKDARKAKGYTQEEMAQLLGYKSKSGYCMIERGVNQPPLKVALSISRLLERPVNELFSDIDVHESGTKQSTA